MYCSAAATLSTRSSWRIVVMAGPSWGGLTCDGVEPASVPRKDRPALCPCAQDGSHASLETASVLAARGVKQAICQRDAHGRQQEGDVDHRLRNQHLVGVVLGVDEGLEQVDRADADDGGGELDLQHRRSE